MPGKQLGPDRRINMKGFQEGVGPSIINGSKVHTDLMKTQALLQALSKYKFDAAFGGARRDEERNHGPKNVFIPSGINFINGILKISVLNSWNLYNARVHKGESIRVFPAV